MLVVLGLSRLAGAQSAEVEPPVAAEPPIEPVPTPAPDPPPLATPIAPAAPPPTAAYPAEPARAPVAAPAQTPSTVQAKATPSTVKRSAYEDEPFGSTSSMSPSSERTVSEPPESSSSDDSSSDIIRLGPVVGVGLPNLVSVGGMLKLTRFFGGGVNVGLIPTTKIALYGDATLSYQEYDVYGRLFPFGGSFFFGAGVGYATVKGTMTDKIDTSTYAGAVPAGISIPNPLTLQSEGSVKTMVVTPQIGYFFTTDIGFSIGLDVGAQIPIAPSDVTFKSHLSLPAGTPELVASAVQTEYSSYAASSDKKVRDTLDTIGRTPLPTVNLRIGWLF